MNIKTHVLIIFFLVISFTNAQSCECISKKLLEYYNISDFVAEIRIDTLTPDLADNRYHNLKFDLIELYKGDISDTSNLKLNSSLNSSCYLYTPPGSRWLIFAYENETGILSFGYCSGSEQIDRIFSEEYSRVTKAHAESMRIKLGVLDLIKSHSNHANEQNLLVAIQGDYIDRLKGVGRKKHKDFAVYELTVNENVMIENIRILKGFKDKRLNRRAYEVLQDGLFINLDGADSIKRQKTKILHALFYYPPEDEYDSFVSFLDL